MESSILDSVKKACNVVPTDTSFDDVLILHINSIFSTLEQVGVGPTAGFMIEDSTATWDSYISNDNRYNMVRSYIGIKVRLMFDPPVQQSLLTAMEKQVEEFEWRLNVTREGDDWTNPNPPPTTPQDCGWPPVVWV